MIASESQPFPFDSRRSRTFVDLTDPTKPNYRDPALIGTFAEQH